MRFTWTRFVVVGLCLLLCAGVLWGKKGTAPGSFDRQDILDQLDQDRDGGKRIAAAGLRLEHAKQLLADGNTAGAVDVLNLIARMDLPDTRPAQRTLTDTFLLLGEIYRDHPGRASLKAASFLDHAIRHMDPQLDAHMLQRAIRDAADLFAAAGDLTQSMRLQQLAEDAAAGVAVRDLGLFPASAGAQEDSGDDTCAEAVAVTLDHSEKMTVDVSGDHNWRSFEIGTSQRIRIETLSPDTFGDDTDLNLYGGCSGSTPTDFIEFDDDDGPGFLSLIELCLAEGEYFVEVGGFNNTSTPDDFDFLVTDLGSCFIPTADDFEPDNESSLANRIGFRNNGDGDGGQGGRDNKQVQEHSIFPALDIDFVEFSLARANRVRLETSGESNPDTIIGFSSPSGQLLATNDDKAPGDLGSRLGFCLPPSVPGSEWFLAIIAFSASDAFEYNVAVDVEGPCLFEDEPNGICSLANEMLPGNVYSGLQTAAGVAENDWWTFTLDEAGFITVSTDGWNIFAVDTFLELYGPAGAGSCPGDLIADDDDDGDGFLSLISESLEAGTYYVNATVSPFSVGSNYPYDIMLEVTEPPLAETEPNDSCSDALANDPFFLGDNVLASISPVGDRDHYTLSLAGDTLVSIDTTGPSGDTVLQVETADGSTIVGCDDDDGPGLFSSFGCCLPAADYCVVVRDFGDNSTISSYNIEFTDLGSCTADAVPVCDVTGLGCPF